MNVPRINTKNLKGESEMRSAPQAFEQIKEWLWALSYLKIESPFFDCTCLLEKRGCMLAKMDDEEIYGAVYYLSKSMFSYEENYSAIEKTDCAMYVKKWHKCQPATSTTCRATLVLLYMGA